MKAIKTPLTFRNGVMDTVTDSDSIAKQKITDVLVTTPGERVMRPTYGAGVYTLLFEPMDELVFSDFQTEALASIEENVTGSATVGLDVVPASEVIDETTLTVTAYYQIPPSTTSSVDIVISPPQ